MKSLENLKELYESDLLPELKSLESKRKAILTRNLISILVIVMGIITFMIGDGNEALVILGFVIIISAFVSFFFTYKKAKIYKKEFKDKVVRKIVELIDPAWVYEPYSSISESEYIQSELFKKSWDRYEGDDLVQGVIEKTDFRISELHTEYKTVTVDSKGRRTEHWHTIFKGLIGHADFNKEIEGKTFVLPDVAERLLGKWGQKLQKNASRGKLVKLENIEFEKYFVVHSDDQIEARYILTPKMMEAIVNIRKQFNREIFLSFIGSRVYVAISFTRNLFEPKIIRSGVRFDDIVQMHNQFNIISVIVHEMNLNTRIWTKD